MKSLYVLAAMAASLIALCACQGAHGLDGLPGKDGAPGKAGLPGKDGMPGATQDGSRLKARYLVASDGARSPTGTWNDTKLGADCTFQVAIDGQTRCLPGSLQSGYWGIQYSDAACLKAVAVWVVSANAACPNETPLPLDLYGRVDVPKTCVGAPATTVAYDVWAFDEPIAQPSGTVYAIAPTCHSVNPCMAGTAGCPTTYFAPHTLAADSFVESSVQ
jgi:hypothetical protein